MTSATKQRESHERTKLRFANLTASLMLLGWNASWLSRSLDRLREDERWA